jgi:hypothetical protein
MTRRRFLCKLDSAGLEGPPNQRSCVRALEGRLLYRWVEILKEETFY